MGDVRDRPAAVRRRPVSPVTAAAVLIVVGLMVARIFLVEPFGIPSSSMAPTLLPGDQVLVDKVSSRASHPRRGDLVVFERPGDPDGPSLKRVVGLAGDKVEIRDGVLTVNDRAVRESYVDYARVDSVYFGPTRVARGQVFVFGDNRGNSRDSRQFGGVPERYLLGRAVARVWPPGRAGSLASR